MIETARKMVSLITSFKGVTIIVILSVSLALCMLLDVPQEEREIALLSSISEAIAVIVAIGVAIFLGMAQIHSPYHTSARSLLTPPTLALLSALLVGLLLALAVLQGSHLTWLHQEPWVFGPLRVSWAHVVLTWFAGCLLALPLYLRYVMHRLGPSGLVADAEDHLMHALSAPTSPIPSVVEWHVKTLGSVAVTALERQEYSTLALAFSSLGDILWKADAAARSESQCKGRTHVILHGLSLQPLPPGQTDAWRLIYREVSLLHNLMLRSPELMIRECGYLRKIGTQAVEHEKASVTVLAVILLITQILDKGIAQSDGEVAKLAVAELGYLSTAAVMAALPRVSRTATHREYLFIAANRAIRGIKDALVTELEEPRLKESIPRTGVWDKEFLRLALANIRKIALTVGGILNSTPERESLLDQDRLGQHHAGGVVHRAIKVLSTLRRALEECGRSSPAGQAAYHTSALGLMSARLGWSTTTKAAIHEMKDIAYKYLNHAGSQFKSAVNAIESIRKMGLTSALESNDGLAALRASSALTGIAQIAIEYNKIDLATDIIGGRNSVVTILGICRHKPVILSHDGDREVANLAIDLKGIAIRQVPPQLQDKALQALHELDEWSKKRRTSTNADIVQIDLTGN